MTRQAAEKRGRQAERICGWWLRLKGWTILGSGYERLWARSTLSRARGR